MKDHLHKLFRRRVEVRANGIIYRGRLIGADEDSLYMIGTTSYLILPLEVVTAVKEEEADEGAWIRRELEGAPRRDPARIEDKRRYAKGDVAKLHSPEPGRDWPLKEPDEDQG